MEKVRLRPPRARRIGLAAAVARRAAMVKRAMFTSLCRFHRVADASYRLHRREPSANNDRND
jgi:hypothetical protein